MARESGHMDYLFLVIVGAIILLGLVMLASASAPEGYREFSDSYYYLKHQLIFGFVPGLAGLLLLSRIPYTFWRRHAWNLLLISIGLLVVVFIPGISAGIGTAHSWISVAGVFSVQPSEIVKLTFLFYLAGWLSQRGKRAVEDVHGGLLPFVGVLGAILILMMLQPDTGTMCIIAAMALVVYFTAGAPLIYVLGLFGAGLASLSLLISLSPYRAARFTTFLHPELDPQGIGYHINQALLAIGTGGFWGLGYGHSRQKFEYLPEAINDSIFAVIAEEMGFVLAVGFLLLFLAFVWRALAIAKSAPDDFAKYVTVGVTAWIVLQAIINIGSMVSLLPMTGVPLPFVSYGGTSLAVAMAAVGVVLNISKHTKNFSI
jgi:cell division protein FtsW